MTTQTPSLGAQDFIASLPKEILTPSKKAALLRAHPNSIDDALNNYSPDIARLVGDIKASELFAAWHEHAIMNNVLTWIAQQNLTTSIPIHTVQAIVACHGKDSLDIIQNRSYALLGLLDWRQADRLAQHLGFPKDAPERLTAAAEAALHHRLENGGHTWSDIETLLPITQTLLGNPSMPQNTLEDGLKTLQGKGQVVYHKGGWQTGGCWQMEQDILDIAHSLAAKNLVNSNYENTLNHIIEAANTAQKNGTGFAFGQNQQQALRMVLMKRFSMIAGYAGSGKTTVLRGVAHILSQRSQTVYVLALSARAAKRAGDSAGVPGKTIAGFLKQLSLGGISLDKNTTLIIDEASMVDLPSLWTIMRRLNGAGLVLVGDPGQLPPIGFGITLHALLDNPNLPATHLDTIYRQDESTGIPYIANLVREGQFPTLPLWQPGQTGVSHSPCKPEDVIDALKRIGRDLQRQGIHPDNIQILAPIKAGPAGVHYINKCFHEQKRRHTQNPLIPGRTDIAVGDPVIWTKNNPHKQLWNGSLGRILDVKDQRILAMIDGKTFELSRADTQNLDLAYALSVHRAQGSQWHTILLPIFPSKLMNRALLYTALTRATHNVVFIGQPLSALNISTNTLPQTGCT